MLNLKFLNTLSLFSGFARGRRNKPRNITDLNQVPDRDERLLRLNQLVSGHDINTNALRRVMVFGENNLLYNRVQKNANTTVMSCLDSLVHPDSRGKDTWDRYDSLVTCKLEDIDTFRQFKRLVVIRNPYTRVLAAFLDKFRRHKIVSRLGPYSLDADGFAQFARFLRDGGLAKNDHWNLQKESMFVPLAGFTHVIRCEELNEKLEPALQDLGFDTRQLKWAELFRFSQKHATGASSRVAAFYDTDTKQIIRKLYMPDFEFLGYDPESI
jgi:hypothetical protein